MRPRRSVLYLPGANERALEKAKTLPADALILDLEDAVAPEAKVDARKRVCDAAASGTYGGRELTIRVNGIDTPWHSDDLRAAAQAGPDAVLVPKINSAAEVHAVARELELAGAPEHTAIWAMIETPVAVLHAEHVPGRAPLLGALSLVLLAARATGKVILDGVFNDVEDLAGFEAECLQGKQFGFDGKTLIHPGQLAPCNRVFAPSEEEIARSRRIIEAFGVAQREGRGVVTVDGRMVEHLHVANAQRILDLAAAIQA